ncbi:MAG TPA: efflux RND transporter periplasmic adaptor subunit [Chthoniobacteraceae bacterium]|nr:efflux RND transporter periplasmic adaptor subunit [Chthoniobacteraceae bacterium]
MKSFLAIATLAALGAAGYWLYPQILNHQRVEGPPERYVAEADRRDIRFSIEVSGDVAPEAQPEVKSEVGGKIKKLYVTEGQEVQRGDLLCEIDDTDLLNEKASVMTQLAGAQLSVDRAQSNYDRAEELFERSLVTKENFDHVTSDLDIAKNGLLRVKSQLQTVEDKLAKTKITSPISGTLLNVNVVEGQVVISAASVNSGTTLMTVADLSKLLLETHVNQIDVTRLKVGNQVTMRVEAVRDEPMKGEITFIAPVASVKSGIKGFQVKASILNPTERLRPGMTVKMSIPVAEAPDAVSVPVSAVFKAEDDRRIVYVLDGEARPEPREVTIGVLSFDYAQILTGLKPGERVLMIEPRLLEKKS